MASGLPVDRVGVDYLKFRSRPGDASRRVNIEIELKRYGYINRVIHHELIHYFRCDARNIIIIKEVNELSH